MMLHGRSQEFAIIGAQNRGFSDGSLKVGSMAKSRWWSESKAPSCSMYSTALLH